MCCYKQNQTKRDSNPSFQVVQLTTRCLGPLDDGLLKIRLPYALVKSVKIVLTAVTVQLYLSLDYSTFLLSQ